MILLKRLLILLCLGAPEYMLAAEQGVVSASRVGMSSDRLARIQPFMKNYVDGGDLAGIVTLVARHGKIVHFEKTGKLNLDTGEEIELDSLFRIYSMTKPVVSVALMMLYEEGKFGLDEPVSKYLPAFKGTKVLVDGKQVDQKYEFTIRNLLSHTAGLTYGVFGNTEVDKMYREAKILRNKDLSEMVSVLGEIPLLYQPGTKWVYSVSADVVGALIEVLSGQALDVHLDEQIFTPLGMQDTFFEVPAEKIDRFGTNHRRDPETGKLAVIDHPDDSNFAKEVTFFSGGGGLVSTARDYFKFSQMLLNGGESGRVRLLSPKTIELMTRNHLPQDVAAGFGERPGVAGFFGFGLGVAVATAGPLITPGSEGTYMWGGAAGTIFWVDPKEDLTAILMVQMMSNPIPLRSQFRTLVYSAIVD
jgi:CubicO group peptidase (beta-lactamase class C family)